MSVVIHAPRKDSLALCTQQGWGTVILPDVLHEKCNECCYFTSLPAVKTESEPNQRVTWPYELAGRDWGATFWQFKKQLATMTIQQRLASLLLLLNDYCHAIVQKAQPGNYLKWHTRHRQCCCAPFARSTMACYPKITHWPLFGSVWTNKASMKKGLRRGQCCLTSV